MPYMDVANQIRAEFSDGRFSPGILMPSEHELTKAFSVSRTTIRKALKNLEDDDFIERRQGQGTFLKFGKYTRRVSSALDFVSHAKQSRGRPSTKLLSFELREKSIAETSLFDAVDGGQVFEMRRLPLMKGEACVLQTSVLPLSELFDYQKRDFEKRSLYKILEQDFSIKIGPVKETLACCSAPQRVVDTLSLEMGVAVFISHRIVRSRSGEVVEFSRNYIRSDRYCFVQDSAILAPTE